MSPDPPDRPPVRERPLAEDTPLEIEAIVLDHLRKLTGAERIARAIALNRAAETFAAAGIRARHGADIPERELKLRLAALRLPRETMVEVFGWDPEKEGY